MESYVACNYEDLVKRILAWLMRNEGVSASAISRAIESACTMKLGQRVALDGPEEDDTIMRFHFINSELARLRR